MSRLIELEKRPDDEEWIWPCDCHSGHFLRATWDADDSEWRYLWIEEAMSSPMWRDRFRDAWLRLRGRSCGGVGVVLSNEAIRDLKAFVDAHAVTSD